MLSPSLGERIVTAIDPFERGRYAYMDQLEALDRCRPQPRDLVALPEKWSRVTTPLKSEEWERELKDLPDRRCAEFVIRGISEGFRLGFGYASHSCRSAQVNMLSATTNPQVIEEYLGNEVALGRVVGPVENLKVQISRFGVIPKGHQKGKWRLILDLSHPVSGSVNDGIDSDLCSLSYTSVSHVAKLVVARGKGCLLAKLDLESAYRMVPVHPEDRLLLGMKWKGSVWMDTTLPFGLRSAPIIFNVVADCLQWMFRRHSQGDVIHYLDDFLFVGAPSTEECGRLLHQAIGLCQRLGVRISLKKLEGPVSSLSFRIMWRERTTVNTQPPAVWLRRARTLRPLIWSVLST